VGDECIDHQDARIGCRHGIATEQAGRPQGPRVLTDAEFEAQKVKILAG
jgi:hypothetical protein